MIKNMFYSECEATREIELVEQIETIKMKGREVTFNATSYRCLTCGEKFEFPEMFDKNLDSAREQLMVALLTPSVSTVFHGMKVLVDTEVPEGEIQMRVKGEVVARIKTC
jgi:hypothetical protein